MDRDMTRAPSGSIAIRLFTQGQLSSICKRFSWCLENRQRVPANLPSGRERRCRSISMVIFAWCATFRAVIPRSAYPATISNCPRSRPDHWRERASTKRRLIKAVVDPHDLSWFDFGKTVVGKARLPVLRVRNPWAMVPPVGLSRFGGALGGHMDPLIVDTSSRAKASIIALAR